MAKEKLFRSTKPIRGEEPKKGEKDSPKRGKRQGWVTWYEFSMRFVYLFPLWELSHPHGHSLKKVWGEQLQWLEPFVGFDE